MSGGGQVSGRLVVIKTMLLWAITFAVGAFASSAMAQVSVGASPGTISPGGSSTISWSSGGLSPCTYNGSAFPTSGSTTVSPATTTTYTLVCAGVAGSATVTVYVPPPPVPSVSTSLSPSSIDYGDTSTLSWSSSNATSCNYGGTSGSTAVGPFYSPGWNTVTVSCSGTGGTGSGSASVYVSPPPPQPTMTLTQSATTVYQGGSITWNWTSTNATSCTTSGVTFSANGSFTGGPYNDLVTNYPVTATCTGPGGSVSQTLTYSVVPTPPSITSFNQSAITIHQGDNITWSWTSSNATSCITSGVTFSANGSFTGGPYNDLVTNYPVTATCTGPGGSVSQTLMYTVLPPPPTITFNVAPVQIVVSSGTTTASWTSTNATSCSLGSGAASGSANVGPYTTTGNKTVSISCTGAGGSNSASAQLNVVDAPPAITSFTQSATTVYQGGSITWSWTSTNATSCTTSGVTFSANGSFTGGPYNDLVTNYPVTATCTGPGGSVSQTLTYSVVPIPPSITSFNQSAITVHQGDNITWNWTSTNATACATSGVTFSANGSFVGGPYNDLVTNYPVTITCTGPGGSVSQTLTYTVAPPPVITSFTVAAPTILVATGVTTVMWASTNADSCSLGNNGNFPASATAIAVGPFTETGAQTITLSCNGPGGSAFSTVQVNVVGQTSITIGNFAPVSDATLQTEVVSAPVSVTISPASIITAQISGDASAQISVDNGLTWGASAAVGNNALIKLKVTSAAEVLTQSVVTLTVGSAAKSWTVTTKGLTAEVSASSGSNVLPNDPTGQVHTIEMLQGDRLDLDIFTPVPTTCTITTVTGGETKQFSFDVAGGDEGGRASTPPNYFADNSQTLTSICEHLTPTNTVVSTTNTIQVNLSEEADQSIQVPEVISAEIRTTDGINLNGGTFSMDTPVKVSWTSANATACFMDGQTYSYQPNSPDALLPPYYFSEAKTYSYGFYCVGAGGVSNVKTVSFTVTEPTGTTTDTSGQTGGAPGYEIYPGFRGGYDVSEVDVNHDNKADLYVHSTGYTSGVSDFVMVSDPNSSAFTFQVPYFPLSYLSNSGTGTQIAFGDMDGDGYQDLVVQSSNSISPIVIFSPHTRGAIPGSFGEGKGYALVDAKFRQFFDELYHVGVNPQYILQNSVTVTGTKIIPTMGPSCDISVTGSPSGVNISGSSTGADYGPFPETPTVDSTGNSGVIGVSSSCSQYPDILIGKYVGVQKLIRLPNGKVDLTKWHDMTNLLNSNCVLYCFGDGIYEQKMLTAGTANARTFSTALSTVLGRPFMGGVLEIPGTYLPYEAEVDEDIRVNRYINALYTEQNILTSVTNNPNLAPATRKKNVGPANSSVTELTKYQDTYDKAFESPATNVVVVGSAPDGNGIQGAGIVLTETADETIITVNASISGWGVEESFINSVKKYWEKQLVDPITNRKYSMKLNLTKTLISSAAIRIEGQVSPEAQRQRCQASSEERSCEIEFPATLRSQGYISYYIGNDKILNDNETWAHEFGHILGLKDFYIELDDNGNPVVIPGTGTKSRAVLGHEADLMGTGSQVFWYHFKVIARLHGSSY